MEMTDIMVDIETTGTNPSHNGIIQIAAVKFNLENQAVGESFDQCPSLLPNRFWDEDTRQFWGKHPAIYDKIVARQEHYPLVFKAFSSFASSIGKPLRFWAKPTTFDWSFLASHYGQLGLPMPFHYRTARDLNTFISARANNTGEHVDMKWVEEAHEGPAHNALSDCVCQLRMLFHAMNGKFS